MRFRKEMTAVPVLPLLVTACCLMATHLVLSSAQQARIRPILRSTSTTTTTTTTTTPPPSSSTTTTTTTTTTRRPRISPSSGSLQTRSISNNNSMTGRLSDFMEDELPPDFYELPPEQLDLGMNATGRAPTPILNVAVLQNNQMIDSAINVHPGTPLEMVIYLDDKSAKVYGLLASYLKVQDDTYRQREEVIISNGCAIDTYIFGNFEHNPDDQSLRAKFRAFKFPDSNFVRFVGTVNVCIKQCAKVNCGGARSKRAALPSSANTNNRLVFTVSTVLRISNPVTAESRRFGGL